MRELNQRSEVNYVLLLFSISPSTDILIWQYSYNFTSYIHVQLFLGNSLSPAISFKSYHTFFPDVSYFFFSHHKFCGILPYQISKHLVVKIQYLHLVLGRMFNLHVHHLHVYLCLCRRRRYNLAPDLVTGIYLQDGINFEEPKTTFEKFLVRKG